MEINAPNSDRIEISAPCVNSMDISAFMAFLEPTSHLRTFLLDGNRNRYSLRFAQLNEITAMGSRLFLNPLLNFVLCF